MLSTDREYRDRQKFYEFIAQRAGTRSWYVVEDDQKSPQNLGGKPIPRATFEQWRREFQELANA